MLDRLTRGLLPSSPPAAPAKIGFVSHLSTHLDNVDFSERSAAAAAAAAAAADGCPVCVLIAKPFCNTIVDICAMAKFALDDQATLWRLYRYVNAAHALAYVPPSFIDHLACLCLNMVAVGRCSVGADMWDFPLRTQLTTSLSKI
jgi:hypothetical protein